MSAIRNVADFLGVVFENPDVNKGRGFPGTYVLLVTSAVATFISERERALSAQQSRHEGLRECSNQRGGGEEI